MSADPKTLTERISGQLTARDQYPEDCGVRILIGCSFEEWDLILAALRTQAGAEEMRERAAQCAEGNPWAPNEARQRIAAEIRALSPEPGSAPADGWEPIETAPTNTAVQVYVPGLDYYGNQGVYAGMLADMGTGRHWMTFAHAMGRDMAGENTPTRWRPLPSPPAEPSRDSADAQEGRA